MRKSLAHGGDGSREWWRFADARIWPVVHGSLAHGDGSLVPLSTLSAINVTFSVFPI
jgi:hypothetical protein